jgi:hypothetical protein
MLRVLTKAFRRRTGLLLALSYLVCVIGPASALALADASLAAHCLTADHHGVASIHSYSDEAVHDHHRADSSQRPGDAENRSPPGQCCGVFCLNAVAEDGVIALIASSIRGRALEIVPQAACVGLGPFRIERPPNRLLSL